MASLPNVDCSAITAGSSSWTALSRDGNGTLQSTPVAVEDLRSLVWETYPQLPDRVQSCPGGSGAEPLIYRGFAARPSSLDSITNNRHNPEDFRQNPKVPEYYRRPLGRGKWCGRLSIRGVDPKTKRTVYRRMNCGSWCCSYCGPRKARTARAAIRSVAENLGLKYFLTLTLDPKKIPDNRFAVPYLRMCFNKFREYLRREYGEPPRYICVLEFTKKNVPHLHILFDRYIDQRWISDTWASLGGGRIVFIKQVTVQNVARYLSKYLTKELLLSAPKGARRITTARSIKLFPKFNSGIAWELLKESIWIQLVKERELDRQFNLFKFISLQMDEENFLKAFEIHDDA